MFWNNDAPPIAGLSSRLARPEGGAEVAQARSGWRRCGSARAAVGPGTRSRTDPRPGPEVGGNPNPADPTSCSRRGIPSPRSAAPRTQSSMLHAGMIGIEEAMVPLCTSQGAVVQLHAESSTRKDRSPFDEVLPADADRAGVDDLGVDAEPVHHLQSLGGAPRRCTSSMAHDPPRDSMYGCFLPSGRWCHPSPPSRRCGCR